MNPKVDRRRYGVIEVRQINSETYSLIINRELWAEIEWSASRRAWCIQDAAGQCLTHVEHIVGQDRDPQAAIRLAKRMILDGRMPSPEGAHAQLRAEQERVRANKQTTNKQQTNKHQTNKPQNKQQTNKRTQKPLGKLIVGDITARSELVPVVEDRSAFIESGKFK
jgi:hypothetical protein